MARDGVDNKFITDKIDYFRKKKGWSKHELTNQTDLSGGTIYEWYNNNYVPTIKNIKTICEALDISLSEFFSTTKEEQIGAYEDELFKLCAEMTDSQRQALLSIAQTLANSDKQ